MANVSGLASRTLSPEAIDEDGLDAYCKSRNKSGRPKIAELLRTSQLTEASSKPSNPASAQSSAASSSRYARANELPTAAADKTDARDSSQRTGMIVWIVAILLLIVLAMMLT